MTSHASDLVTYSTNAATADHTPGLSGTTCTVRWTCVELMMDSDVLRALLLDYSLATEPFKAEPPRDSVFVKPACQR